MFDDGKESSQLLCIAMTYEQYVVIHQYGFDDYSILFTHDFCDTSAGYSVRGSLADIIHELPRMKEVEVQYIIGKLVGSVRREM